MANGVAVRLPCTPEIPAAAPQSFDECVREDWIGWIGAIVTELADLSMQAAREIEKSGGLDPRTRLQGGDLIARLVVLQSRIGEREFDAAVHRVGRTRRGVPLSTAVKDDIVEIVGQVAAAAREMN